MKGMGLEAFKTEGPRTRTKSNKKSGTVKKSIHVLKGTDPDQSMVPEGIPVHEVICRERIEGFNPDSTKDLFVCEECKRTAQKFEVVLKVDKLEHKDTSWYSEFMENSLQEARSTSRIDTLGDFSLEQQESEGSDSSGSSSTDSDDSDDEPSSGLMSFKS